MPDWTGNSTSIYANHGASNHSKLERAEYDYYATDPVAVEKLLEVERFSPTVWEPACGEGHISKVLESHGYNVKSSDIIDRGLPNTEIIDFLAPIDTLHTPVGVDIVTNPPYKYAKEFVERALDISKDSAKVAMFLKLTFLEGNKRLPMFQKYPPKRIHVFSKRVNCALNGDFTNAHSAVCYAWFVWEKGYTGDPAIRWI